jgi:hypothetical protein
MMVSCACVAATPAMVAARRILVKFCFMDFMLGGASDAAQTMGAL